MSAATPYNLNWASNFLSLPDLSLYYEMTQISQ